MKKDTNFSFTTKGLASTAVVVALLIGVQFVFSFVPGIELVSLLLCVFCVAFGPVYGVIAAIAFALLRAFVFGFNPNVMILYVVYYPAFALATGFYGRLLKRARYKGDVADESTESPRKPAKKGTIALLIAVLTVLVALITCTFTLLDDVITPFVMGFGRNSTAIYFYRSLPVMATQVACAATSVAVLFYPAWIAVEKIKCSMRV